MTQKWTIFFRASLIHLKGFYVSSASLSAPVIQRLAAIIVNLHLHKAKIFVHSHVDKSNKHLKNIPVVHLEKKIQHGSLMKKKTNFI